jgi:signal transduction histidine kinase
LREEINRLNNIVEEFLSLARRGRLDQRPVAVSSLLEKTAALFQAAAQAKGVQLQVQVAAACPPVFVDEQKIQQVLVNIVKNGLEAIAGPGRLQLAAAPAAPDRIRLTITDTGKGMAPEELAHIFDPYYTTKERGLGLGLALAYEIIRAHGGEIAVQSQPEAGTTVTILLPRPA